MCSTASHSITPKPSFLLLLLLQVWDWYNSISPRERT
jgi:hypothetical protein